MRARFFNPHNQLAQLPLRGYYTHSPTAGLYDKLTENYVGKILLFFGVFAPMRLLWCKADELNSKEKLNEAMIAKLSAETDLLKAEVRIKQVEELRVVGIFEKEAAQSRAKVSEQQRVDQLMRKP